MLWSLLATIATIITSPFRGPVGPEHSLVDPDPHPHFTPTPYGPQTWEERIAASNALYRVEDDMRFNEDPSYAGINNTNLRWDGYPGKPVIVWELTAAAKKHKNLTKLLPEAIKQFEKLTCIRFKQRTNEKAYVKIVSIPGQCWSHVGKQPSYWQPQEMSLGEGCFYVGTIVHEFGHALGLFHEHQRSDRDTYLNVNLRNVETNMTHNFNKTDKVDEMTFGAAYDYQSIMHYGEYAFSKQPGKLKTMWAKDGKTKIQEPFDKPGLDNKDIDLLKKLYKCK